MADAGQGGNTYPMSFQEYSLLLASVSRPLNQLLLSLFSSGRVQTESVSVAESISAARRALAERAFDLILINAPLPDGFGTRLAVDTCLHGEAGVMLLVPRELYEELCEKTLSAGVIVAAKPMDTQTLIRNLRILCAVRERLRRQEEKRATVEEKIEEIRLVNRAKWLLIERTGMREAEAHRYIEKQAMDRRISRRKIAESIIQTYK